MLALQASVYRALDVAGHERRLGIMSARADICASPNIGLSIEKTRSAAAELGVNEPTICIASAHVGELLAVVRPEAEHVLAEFVGILVVIGLAGALGQVSRQLPLECLDISPAPG